MSLMKNIIIYNQNTNEKSRIHLDELGCEITDKIEIIYDRYIFSEDNLDYLSQAIGIDKNEIDTKRKLKRKLHGELGMDKTRDLFMSSPAMDNIISELLSQGIIKNQYKLSSFGNYKEPGLSKQVFDNCLYGKDEIEYYNAKVIQAKTYYKVSNGESLFIFNKQSLECSPKYNEILELDGISFPEIINDDNTKNARYVKRCINKLVAKGKEIKINDASDSDYDYLINVDEEAMRFSISSDLAYYYYEIEASGHPKNCYLEMNDSYNDKKEIYGRILEHLFLVSQIINKDGEEFASELSAGFGSYYEDEAYKEHNEFIDYSLSSLSEGDFISSFLFYEGKSFDEEIERLKQHKDGLQKREKDREDKLLSQKVPDKVIADMLEIEDNITRVEEKYDDALINTVCQLKNKFGTTENLLNKFIK